MIDFACPHCGKIIGIPEQLLGRKGRCPQCNGPFMVALLEPAPSPQADSNVKGEGDRKLPFNPAEEVSSAVAARVKSDLENAEPGDNILDQHYAYEELIASYYESRDSDPFAISLAVQACLQQIALAPVLKKVLAYEAPGQPLPPHAGFATLANIREKQGRYDEVAQLCGKAKAEGWAGDWDDRVNRCKKTFVLRKANGTGA